MVALGWGAVLREGNHEFHEGHEWDVEQGVTMERGWVCGTCSAEGSFGVP
jgi:hypothetical protein